MVLINPACCILYFNKNYYYSAMLSIQAKMEANAFKSIESYRYHIHNYSPLAVKSFIYEIQKYPIIFSAKSGVILRKELVEFAWTRITVALLDTVVPTQHKVALINLEYWNQSFRQLWKWMVDIYLKKRLENKMNIPRDVCIQSLKYQWFDFMHFLDPHLKNFSNTSNPLDLDPQYHSNIRLEVLPADTKIIHLETGNHIILWLRKFSESINAKIMCISVCMQIQRCFSPPLPLGLESMFKQDEDIDESQLVKYLCKPLPYPYRAQNRIRLPPTSTAARTSENVAGTSLARLRAVKYDMIIDKDYLYIMSLYPKLASLEPCRKVKVKRLMILALIDGL